MSNRVSALSSILRSPAWILGIVLALVFTVEVCVMLVMPYLMPRFWGETATAIADALLLTLLCAPVLWWVIIGPLRRIAIQEHLRSETIVAGASEGILTLNEQGEIQSSNRAMTDLVGVNLEELIGQPARQWIDQLSCSMGILPTTLKTTVRRANGEEFPAEVSIRDYPSESQPLRIAVIRDLTQSQRAEEERLIMAREKESLRAQQMATLAQLATGVAHEIRNPLTSIKMLIQVNREALSKEGFETDDLELVEHEIRRMERSVSGLLDFARPEDGERRLFQLDDVLRTTSQLIEGRCKQQNVELNIESNFSESTLHGDPAQIQQLLLNLSLNAIDAMPDGGALSIRANQREKVIEIVVSDTGNGIRDDILPRLFTPFATSKTAGVGLGLSICRRIAESHGGNLSGHNRLNGGAEFVLTLPLANDDAATLAELTRDEASCKVC
ncbi:PAS domain S-box protein [Rhodopirellula sp. JC740]|uniref:histidine kinase n=1 Tax=Rhodopirellula halodulae TaxID=2894198 RepID=A0ABS8NNQ4_9BACT|nr:PAS domain S-box protein [Rhodopirellula sp. JC740]